eukprot:TRINITY_DN29647_c0_g1_i1.p1 TRINITY_DN29647_c0_g1~~TRINITY_DN29647_c0_g1_i1.p1  ORF type:complete len:364 (+),score=34.64 TRINITY_DN29647_c0_g1_i1:120-1094(+)
MATTAVERSVILSVFMEGTANPMDAVTTQIALFSRLCIATALSEDGTTKSLRAGHYKICFAGCGVTHGTVGTLFAVGLREQCAVIRGYVSAFLELGLNVTINFVGLSRGGIGGLYLAQELAGFDRAQIVLNMLLFDPVPGNLIWMAKWLDWAGQMNTNQAMDVSSCTVLGRVLVLYPYEPLPAIAFHAPLIPVFPENCNVEMDVILGCHQGALWTRPRRDTCLAFARIRDFLLELGSKLDRAKNLTCGLDVSDERLATMLCEELRCISPSTRSAHCEGPEVFIVRRSKGTYLNRSHEALVRRLGFRAPQEGDVQDHPRFLLDFE